jgi:hypothetical protein
MAALVREVADRAAVAQVEVPVDVPEAAADSVVAGAGLGVVAVATTRISKLRS